MYNEVWYAVFWFFLKIEFVIMIIKFICPLFSKNRVKIAVNAVFLLLFDLGCLLVFNSADCDFFMFAIFLCLFIEIIFNSSDIIAAFEPDKTVDNNNSKNINNKREQRRMTKTIKKTLPHIPIGKTIKTKNIKSIPSDNIISME